MPALDNVDIVWLLFCSSLLLLMQAGFTCLEAGLIRNKNSINVVMKNLIDLCIAFLIFGMFGIGIMYLKEPEFVSLMSLPSEKYGTGFYVFVLFQTMFCATAVTIISGATAERMTFFGYMVIAMITAAVIYPIVGNWVWGTALSPDGTETWLTTLGFYDYAGATVVHSTGGWVALALLLIIGPRIGRFGKDGKPITSSSIVLTCTGMLLIWVGWIGFNGGSLLEFNESVAKIIVNTITGGTAGLCGGLVFALTYHRKAIIVPVINGGLIGLISVTGCANLIEPKHALIIGFVVGLLPTYFDWLLIRFKIDDAIGALPVHLFGGILATIITGFFVTLAPEQSRLNAILVQVLGVISVGAFAFTSAFCLFYLVNKIIPLRVSVESEIMGLNISEHNERAFDVDIVSQLTENVKTGEVLRKISVDPQSDNYEVAKHYNSIITKFEEMHHQQKAALENAVALANQDKLTKVLNKFAIYKEIEHQQAMIDRYDGSACLAVVNIDNLSKINDKHGRKIGDQVIKHVAETLQKNIREADIIGRFNDDNFYIVLPNTTQLSSDRVTTHIKNVIYHSPYVYDKQSVVITVSIGLCAYTRKTTFNTTLSRAETALRDAKRGGKNKVVISV